MLYSCFCTVKYATRKATQKCVCVCGGGELFPSPLSPITKNECSSLTVSSLTQHPLLCCEGQWWGPLVAQHWSCLLGSEWWRCWCAAALRHSRHTSAPRREGGQSGWRRKCHWRCLEHTAGGEPVAEHDALPAAVSSPSLAPASVAPGKGSCTDAVTQGMEKTSLVTKGWVVRRYLLDKAQRDGQEDRQIPV